MGKELILPNRFKNQVTTGDQRNKAVVQITAGDLKKIRVQIAADIEKEIRRSLEGERAAMVRESLISMGWLPPDATCENCYITDRGQATEEYTPTCDGNGLCHDWKSRK